MTLQDIFDALSAGELSQISIGGQAAGVINKENRAKLLPHINMGLTALFKRFRLKEGELIIQLEAGRTRYPLTGEFSQSAGGFSGTPFILDSDNPFVDDLLKVEEVYAESGKQFPLNDAAHLYSVKTPQTKVLTVPADVVTKSMSLPDDFKTDTLRVVYRANHTEVTFDPKVDYSYVDGSELELPDSHLEALLYFVASRVNNPMGMTNEFHAGNTYYTKYEQACQELDNQGMQADLVGTNIKARLNGWV